MSHVPFYNFFPHVSHPFPSIPFRNIFPPFFSEAMMELLCNWTNMYDKEEAHHLPSMAKNWTPLYPEELYRFIRMGAISCIFIQYR